MGQHCCTSLLISDVEDILIAPWFGLPRPIVLLWDNKERGGGFYNFPWGPDISIYSIFNSAILWYHTILPFVEHI